MNPRLRGVSFLLVFLIGPVSAQEESAAPASLDELRVPISPAFNILGVTPVAVERPNTPRAFATTVLSALERSEGGFPSNFAMEFAPYWWKSRPITFEEYYAADVKQTILQTLSVSVATTEIAARDSAPTVEGTRLGFGVRFHLNSGDPAPGLEDAVHSLKRILILRALLADLPEQREELETLRTTLGGLENQDPPAPQEEIDAVKEEISQYEALVQDSESQLRDEGFDPGKSPEDLDKELDKLIRPRTNKVTEMDRQRVGWIVETAAAAVVDYEEGNTGHGEFSRIGGWLTMSYTEPEGSLDQLTFLGLARYTWDDTDDLSSNLIDLGSRLVWRSKDSPVALSAEYIARIEEEGNGTKRLAGMLEYKLTDAWALFASFGNDFDSDFDGEEDLLASIGINFGFGKNPVEEVKTK